MTDHAWEIRGRTLTLGRRPLVMGIVNVTPDSFSDGGRHATTDAAVAHAMHLVAAGADLLDIGGESTRPGSRSVSLDEELARTLPVVRELARHTDVPLSVDTSKAEVARQALAAGAHIVNDVTGLLGEPEMPATVRDAAAGAVVMHMQGTPATMQLAPSYRDVVAEVYDWLESRLHALGAVGIAPTRVAVDVGIGFGKTTAHNLRLLARLAEFRRLGRPVLLGVSRKGFLGQVLGGRPAEGRVTASVAAVLHAAAAGAVQIARVHDVAETRDALAVFEAIDAHH
jgi:dihydropteroate synthase